MANAIQGPETTRRWRLTVEIGSEVFGGGWWPTTVDGSDYDRLLAEYNACKKWERTGEHPVRNIVLEEI